jgi:glycosyltransferase involved in cell wall biosynthesis
LKSWTARIGAGRDLRSILPPTRFEDRQAMIISIVIPVYNGAATIGALVGRLIDVLDAYSLQIVLVNDGSADRSDEVCRALQANFPEQVVYVKLAKNFGEHNAVMAGLHRAAGDYVVIMDDDFQNPPEEVVRLIDYACTHDDDVVYTRYPRRRHHWLRILGSHFNDRVAGWLCDKPPGLYLSSFKCLNAFTVKEIIQYRGPFPYVDGLILRCTRSIGTIEVRHDPRREGRSNYTLRKLVSLWLNMSVNFSVRPLRVSTLMGLTFSGSGFVLGIAMAIKRLLSASFPIGWASMIVAILVLSGIQLAMLGIVGEYLGRLFLMCNHTPQFVVREVLEKHRVIHENFEKQRDDFSAQSIGLMDDAKAWPDGGAP